MALKLAFTGTGFISKIHAAAAQKLPGVEPAAVVNHRPESMAAFAAEFNIPHQYGSVEALLADLQIDAICISTPNYLHAPQSVAALEAGVHVMVEKPMALNTAEAEFMLKAAQKSGALLMVAHCWRFDEEILWLKEQVDRGRLGRIVRTRGYGIHVNWGPGGWFTQKKFAGGGALVDMGIHAIDTARFLLGDPEPAGVYAKIDTCYKDYDVDDTGLIMISWRDGVTSYIESGWWQPHADGPEAATQLYGTQGFGRVFPTGLALPGPDETVQEIDPGFPPVRDPHCPQIMYDNQLAYFVRCIRTGQTPVPGGLEGWLNMKILDAAYESAQQGKVVAL